MISDICVTTERRPTVAQFLSVLKRSTLDRRRPVDDVDALGLMVENATFWATAWHGEELIGVARSLTDFAWCCYLSDLAVDAAWQRRGVGRRLIAATRAALPAPCTLILLAAPAAAGYYPRLGFEQHPSAWTLKGGPVTMPGEID
ncbi:MAG: GNAT family N-acetyltransferase [Verrucomicrobiales bacterium]|nr:GNAT family N-acetyltransferase [Verrucomicrobiales bacterium]